MNFCENLQMLRKEHNLSQEQLAEKLDVSRQAVSKWESGQSYPEMDKIIAMCKIFNCSMDALVNESITDIKETEKRAKNSIITYIEEFLDFVSKTVKMLTSMKFSEFVKCAIELFIIGMVILVFRIPVEYIGSLGSRLFSILPSFLSYFVIQVWYFILNLSYFILAIIVFVHIFKTRYLDYFEEIDIEKGEEKPVEISNDKKESEVKPEPIKKERIFKERRDNLHSFVNILSKIMTLFIKSLIITISLPFLVSLLMFAIFLVISIGLLFQGVIYFGITIAIISALVFNIFLIETLYNLIFNKKNNLNKIFIVLLSTIIGLGIGIGITSFDVANSKFINEVPSNIKQASKEEIYNMSNELVIDDWHYINYVADESLVDKVKVEVKYYPEYSYPTMETYNNQLQVYRSDTEQINFSKLYKLTVSDLKKKQLHNYNLLYDFEVTVYSSTANIDKLKTNTKAYYDHIAEEQNNYQNMINQYEQTIQYYQGEMSEYQNKIYELESENETQKNEYEFQIQEYQNKIQEYKDKINNLIME